MLRPDRDAKGRSTSKNRERSRSRARDSSPGRPVKAKKEPQLVESDNEPKYAVRETSVRTPGLSKVASNDDRGRGRDDNSEEERELVRDRQGLSKLQRDAQKYAAETRSSKARRSNSSDDEKPEMDSRIKRDTQEYRSNVRGRDNHSEKEEEPARDRRGLSKLQRDAQKYAAETRNSKARRSNSSDDEKSGVDSRVKRDVQEYRGDIRGPKVRTNESSDDGESRRKVLSRGDHEYRNDPRTSQTNRPGHYEEDDRDRFKARQGRTRNSDQRFSKNGRALQDDDLEYDRYATRPAEYSRPAPSGITGALSGGISGAMRAVGLSSADKDQAVPYPTSSHHGMPEHPEHEQEAHSTMPGGYGYADQPAYQYAQPTSKASYSSKQPPRGSSQSAEFQTAHMPQMPDRTISSGGMRDIRPSEERIDERTPRSRSHRLSVSNNVERAPSPGGHGKRTSISNNTAETLSLGAGLGAGLGSGLRRSSHAGPPPASPLLEAYRGTYQSASPMPSPMALPHDDDSFDDIEEMSLSTREPRDSLHRIQNKTERKVDSKPKKRVVVYNAEDDADKLANAMKYGEAKPLPLIEILPLRTHDQLLALREQYKKRVKVQGKGVNIAKQIKATTTGNFGKICYVTSLGRFESESHWSNFFYQSHSSNRELLIEALMGRTNADIREINDNFKDKKYGDDLSLCMEKELKPDKFRTAILMALECRRQEETDVYPVEYRNKDVEVLGEAIKARGGETSILEIVVKRSDNHLRGVLKAYERVYESNFARDALKKSNNLVGEVIAHILNGVINRAARDVLLMRHAINDIAEKNRDVELRYELLISRLVRLHWDRPHLARVKRSFLEKYQVPLEKEIEEATKGSFREFCLKLCET